MFFSSDRETKPDNLSVIHREPNHPPSGAREERRESSAVLLAQSMEIERPEDPHWVDELDPKWFEEEEKFKEAAAKLRAELDKLWAVLIGSLLDREDIPIVYSFLREWMIFGGFLLYK